MSSSEGESVVIKLGKLISYCSKLMHKKKADTIILLLDNFDSNISIDVMQEFKKYFLKNTIESMQKNNKHCYILMAVNHYEILENMPCIDIQNTVVMSFSEYNTYREWVLGSRRLKDERIEMEKEQEVEEELESNASKKRTKKWNERE